MAKAHLCMGLRADDRKSRDEGKQTVECAFSILQLLTFNYRNYEVLLCSRLHKCQLFIR